MADVGRTAMRQCSLRKVCTNLRNIVSNPKAKNIFPNVGTRPLIRYKAHASGSAKKLSSSLCMKIFAEIFAIMLPIAVPND